MTETTILSEVRGELGVLTLNRPKAINALDVSMMDAVPAVLDAWRSDESVRAVALVGAGDRGFCAGGDVRAVRQAHLDGDDAARFFRAEYAVDLAVAEYPKPVVAVMDGITMGGGVGLGMNADLRVVTERTQMAMPETIIGFFPDVGATYRLARSPGELGTHVALTGATFGAGDAIALGLADTLVDSSSVEGLLDGLAKGEPLDASVGETAPPSGLVAEQAWIDECYAGDDPVVVVHRLEGHSSAEARAAAEQAQTLRDELQRRQAELEEQIEGVLNAFEALSDEHARQENMTLPELKDVIRDIYPALPPLYVIEFVLIEA